DRLELGNIGKIEKYRRQEQIRRRHTVAGEIAAAGEATIEDRDYFPGLVQVLGYHLRRHRQEAETGRHVAQRRVHQRITDGAHPLVAKRGLAGFLRPQFRTGKTAVEIAQDRGRLVEREVAVADRGYLPEWIERHDLARHRRHQFVVDALFVASEPDSAGEGAG